MSAQIPINTIKNSCIVNNANIAMQNVPNPQGTLTPLDASNNWWGMPVGASDQNRAGGDWVGWNITNQPHLTTIPQNCDLSDANWIPFSEQELQHAILSQLPYVGALDFVLLDMQKGYGAKFTLVAKPEYGGERGEAYISIAPSDDGTWMMLMLDFSRLPTTTASDNLSQIATCSLMPLFLNSLQQVQSRFTQPSQLIEQMVVMDSALMILFTAPTEITPDPAPSLVMNYDSSCLPIPMTPTPAPTPVSPQDEDESGWLGNIPPREGGIGLMENNINLQQTTANMCTGLPDEPIWCILLSDGDVFSYSSSNGSFFINRIDDQIITISIEDNMPNYSGYPSWGAVTTDHYRFAYNCSIELPQIIYGTCYWDSQTKTHHYRSGNPSGPVEISPKGSKIAYEMIGYGSTHGGITTYSLQEPNSIFTPLITQVTAPRWSDDNTLYYRGYPGLIQYYDNTITNQVAIDDTSIYHTFDVRSGDILYWKHTDLYRYINSTSTYIMSAGLSRYEPLYDVHWSPQNANQFVAVRNAPQQGNPWRKCLMRYDIATSVSTEIFCGNINPFINWAGPNSANGNISYDLRFMIPIQQFTCLIPDPTASPADTINLCIQELAEYGIIAFPNGVPPQPIDVWDRISQQYITANWTSSGTTWSIQDLQEILRGIYDTAEAFYLLRYGQSSGEGGNGPNTQQLFKNVMSTQGIWRDWNGVIHDGFFLLRVQNTFNYSNADLCNGSGDEGCTSNNWGAIALYGNYSFNNPSSIKYTFVHELGHRFDNQSGVDQPRRLSDYMDGQTDFPNPNNFLTPPLLDCNRLRVMGKIPNNADWVRGYRGWGDVATLRVTGSIPQGINNVFYLTIFQRNPLEFNLGATPNADQTGEIGEAAADMFLNWVYRRITDRWSTPSLWVDLTKVDGVARDANNAPLYCGLPHNHGSDWGNTTNPDNAWQLLHNLPTTWSGFRNIAPDYIRNYGWDFTNPIYDFDRDLSDDVTRSSLSGNARYFWMEKTLKIIFDRRLSNWN